MTEYTAAQDASQFKHDLWSQVLMRYTDDKGYVDYLALTNNRSQFDQYLKLIKNDGPKTSPQRFNSKNEKLAYYINAYNALVFEGVLNRGPEEKSVWRGLVSGLNFFVRMKIIIDTEQTNLKQLEDVEIREGFKDPRIHAALNCASISCPRLPQVAFEADRLDRQLDAAMTEFTNLPVNVNVDDSRRIVYLSKIFDWFEEDFIVFEKTHGNNNEKSALINYVNRYRQHDSQIPLDYKIKFIKYNKRINQQTG